MKFKFSLISVLILFTVFAYGQDWQWQSYTSMQEVRSLCYADSTLWCGTEGGIAAYNIFDQSKTQWTNTEGLAGNDIQSIVNEGKSAIWIGFENGCIQKYNLIENSWMTIREYEGRKITCLHIHGDSLFIGLDIGLSIYLISKSEVKETYKRLGTDFQVELLVEDILIHDNEVWVATEEGIAKGRLGNVNLLDPNNWQNISTRHGLPGDDCLSLSIWNNQIFAATNNGLSVLNGSDWDMISANVYSDLQSWTDGLYASGSNAVYKWDGTFLNQVGPSISSNVILINDDLMSAGGSEGVYVYQNNIWDEITFNSMKTARATALDVNQGVLWVCSGTEGYGGGMGAFRLEETEWFTYNRNNLDSLDNNETYSVAVDQQGNTWIGTWGSGIIKFGQDSSITYYNADNGYLSTAVSSNPSYAVVTDMVCDQNGTVWICNYLSQTDYPVISVTQDGTWTYYGLEDGIYSNSVDRIAVDTNGLVWIGTRDSGIYLIDTNYTPADKSDDQDYRLNTSDGIESNVISALLATDDGTVWVGTSEGLQACIGYSPGPPVYGLYSNNITSLTADGVGNVWAGTKSGISVQSGSQWINFSEEESDLISNDVLSIAADQESGYIYAGTTKGVSRLSTPYLKPVESIQELKIYPSPFIPDNHKKVIIDNLIWNVSVNIFTSSGLLIKSISNHMDVNGRQVTWDGTDENGELVPSGVYFVVMNNIDGEKQLGKIALIR